MTAIPTTTKPTAAAPRARRFRFSLGWLFIIVTVLCVTLFALVQLGPFAAARDLGLGIALALTGEAIYSWRWKIGLAAAAAAIFGCAPGVLAANAPFVEDHFYCEECGMSRHMRVVCGWKTQDEVRPNDVSHWTASLVPAGHRHTWSTSSTHVRVRWFGGEMIGCGGPPHASAWGAYQLARLGDYDEACATYHEYQEILTGKSAKPMATLEKEMRDAVDAAVKARTR